jgi:hypothetical protein
LYRYNADVNFTVLRVYQFYPTYANAGVVQKILLMVRRVACVVVVVVVVVVGDETFSPLFSWQLGFCCFTFTSLRQLSHVPFNTRTLTTHRRSTPVRLPAAQGLMRAPSTEFSVYLHMLSESLQKDDPIPGLAELGKWLAACNFADFWGGVDKLGSAVFGQAKGFDHAVRVAIVGLLAVSHSKVGGMYKSRMQCDTTQSLRKRPVTNPRESAWCGLLTL